MVLCVLIPGGNFQNIYKPVQQEKTWILIIGTKPDFFSSRELILWCLDLCEGRNQRWASIWVAWNKAYLLTFMEIFSILTTDTSLCFCEFVYFPLNKEDIFIFSYRFFIIIFRVILRLLSVNSYIRIVYEFVGFFFFSFWLWVTFLFTCTLVILCHSTVDDDDVEILNSVDCQKSVEFCLAGS